MNTNACIVVVLIVLLILIIMAVALPKQCAKTEDFNNFGEPYYDTYRNVNGMVYDLYKDAGLNTNYDQDVLLSNYFWNVTDASNENMYDKAFMKYASELNGIVKNNGGLGVYQNDFNPEDPYNNEFYNDRFITLGNDSLYATYNVSQPFTREFTVMNNELLTLT